MNNYLKRLRDIAYSLYLNHMKQCAGNIDYLVSWLRSPEYNNGIHLRPHPAGLNTVDEHSNNCPIPYYATYDLISSCTSLLYAEILFSELRDIITELKSIYTDDVEIIALDSYLEYIDDITVLAKSKGAGRKIVAKVKTPCVLNSGSNVILIDANGNQLEHTYDKQYIGLYYYNSENSSNPHMINNNKENGIYLSRSVENRVLRLHNETGESITVDHIELIVMPINCRLAYAYGLYNHDDEAITIGPDRPEGIRWPLMDEYDNKIAYVHNKTYTGVIYHKASYDSGYDIFDNNRESGAYLDKMYDTEFKRYILAVYYAGDDRLIVNSIEYIESNSITNSEWDSVPVYF